jgi:hypothetical protein
MHIDPSAAITDLNGTPMAFNGEEFDQGRLDAAKAEGVETKSLELMTIGWVLVEALTRLHQSETTLSFADKADRWELAARLHKQMMPVKIDKKEEDLLKRLVGLHFPVLICGQVNLAFAKAVVNGVAPDPADRRTLRPGAH